MFRYMVVDDEQLERKVIQIIIKKRELPLECVAEAGHGAEAVEKAALTRPDLIFMDIKMPGMSGMEAAREILKEQPQCHLVFLTAYDQFEYARKGLQMGASDYLLKPVRPDVLEETCSRLIEDLIWSRRQAEAYQRLQKELEISQPIIEHALIYNLLCGNSRDYEEYRGKLTSLNINFSWGVVLVVSAKNNARKGSISLNNLVAGFLEDKTAVFTIPIQPNKIALLLSDGNKEPGLSPEGIKNFAGHLSGELAVKLGCRVNVGIGRKHQFSSISQSYHEANNAANLAELLQGANPVLHINECLNFYATIPDYPYELENKLNDLVAQGNVSGSQEYARKIFIILFQKNSQNIVWIKARCFQLLGVLSKTALDAGVGKEELLPVNAALEQQLLEIDGGPELESWLQQCAVEITDLIGSSRELSSNRVIKAAQEYVEQNMHKNITLEDICRIVFLNSQYFSRLFKKETGLNFTEYLSRRRIEKAKQLLKTEDLPVAVVARKVGFADANYFSRVFARMEGVPPSEFARSGVGTTDQ